MFQQPHTSYVRQALWAILFLPRIAFSGEPIAEGGEVVVVPVDTQQVALGDHAEQPMIIGDESGVAAGDERVIYSNTFGQTAIAFGADLMVSDDIITTAAPGCQLTRLSFDVTGRVDPESPVGGPYSVTWALYNTCPYAVSSGTARDARRIVFGSVNIPDNARRRIEIILDRAVALPAHLWFGLTFSRDNAGPIAGAPAAIGHSADIIDFPGSACEAFFGGFPNQPHGSFNLELWGGDCNETNVQFSARDEGRSTIQTAGEWLVDDITLLSDSCLLRGYMVGVRGPGTYQFELRDSCGGAVIPGTQGTRIVGQSSGQEPRIFELTFDPPIPLPRQFSYAVRASNPFVGPMKASRARIGATDAFMEVEDAPGNCEVISGSPFTSALNFAVICDGPAAVAACCDRYMTFCAGGPRSGMVCGSDTDCGRGGHCQSTCRDTPEINCFRADGAQLCSPPLPWVMPQWHEGATCAANPCAPAGNE